MGFGGTALSAPVRLFRRYISCILYGLCDALRANNYFSGPQFGAAGAGIGSNFLDGRRNGFGCEQAQSSFVTTHANRYVRRAEAVFCLAPHKFFD